MVSSRFFLVFRWGVAFLLSGAALFLFSSSAAFAQSQSHRYHHHEGAKGKIGWPQASLQASASSQVAQDTVKITVSAQVNESNQKTANAKLTQALDAGMKTAKEQDTVKVYSGNVRVWPFTNDDGEISRWQGRGELILESSDFTAASALAAELAGQLTISNVSFSVSPQARAKAEEALLEKAAKAFRKRAHAFATAFGFEGYVIKELDLGGAGAEYSPAPRMMAMAADTASVPLEGNTENVTVSVQGTVYLKSGNK